MEIQLISNSLNFFFVSVAVPFANLPKREKAQKYEQCFHLPPARICKCKVIAKLFKFFYLYKILTFFRLGLRYTIVQREYETNTAYQHYSFTQLQHSLALNWVAIIGDLSIQSILHSYNLVRLAKPISLEHLETLFVLFLFIFCILFVSSSRYIIYLGHMINGYCGVGFYVMFQSV